MPLAKPTAAKSKTAAKPSGYLKMLRVPEVALMTGFFLTGTLFATESISARTLLRGLWYAAGSFCFILSVYAFNAYGGYNNDAGNKRLHHLGNMSAKGFLRLAAFFGLLAALLYGFLNTRILLLAALSYLCWVAYSYPSAGLKNYPILGTLVHFVTQMLHFGMGYLVFKQPDGAAWRLAVYFALLFSAAHFNHELIDYEADKQKNSRTTAVVLGKRTVDFISLALFAVAAAYLLYLHTAGAPQLVGNFMLGCFSLAFALQLATKLATWKSKGRERGLMLYRSLYRAYYAIAALAVLTYQLAQLPNEL